MNKFRNSDLVASVINQFGKGGHPYAEESTLEYFETEYVLECLNKAHRSGKLNQNGRKICREEIAHLRNK